MLVATSGRSGSLSCGQPCGASCSTIRDPHTDRHQMWRKWTGCTRDSISSVLRSAGIALTYPGTLSEAVEAKLVGDLGGVHGVLDCTCQSIWPSCNVARHGGLTGKSCLLAKTRRRASRSSSSFSIRWSSSRASTTRSRSLLSTTKMIPCVFWK
jgi:hypothetical protein